MSSRARKKQIKEIKRRASPNCLCGTARIAGAQVGSVTVKERTYLGAYTGKTIPAALFTCLRCGKPYVGTVWVA